MIQYWKKTTAALQPTCGEERREVQGWRVPRGPTSGCGDRHTASLSAPNQALETYTVGFPAILTLYPWALWAKLAIHIIHLSMYLLYFFWLQIPVTLGISSPQPVAGCMWLGIAMDAVQHKMVNLFKMLGDFFLVIFFGIWISRFSSMSLISNNMVSQCQKVGQKLQTYFLSVYTPVHLPVHWKSVYLCMHIMHA